MRILCVIPARGGSKRLPGKNVRLLGDKPLINWTIDAVRDCTGIDNVLVSTDSEEIAEIARHKGALVPWLRPKELATDTATSVAVVRHALDWYIQDKGQLDGVMLLQPTSPFRRKFTIEKGIKAFRESGRTTVVGVSPSHTHPLWSFRIENDRLNPFVSSDGLNLRSQDLPPAYAVNGSFYLISPETIISKESLIPVNSIPLIVTDLIESIDIDNEFDWMVANAALKTGQIADE